MGRDPLRIELFGAIQDEREATLEISALGPDLLNWRLVMRGDPIDVTSSAHINSIRARIRRIAALFPVDPLRIRFRTPGTMQHPAAAEAVVTELAGMPGHMPWFLLEHAIKALADRRQTDRQPPAAPTPPKAPEPSSRDHRPAAQPTPKPAARKLPPPHPQGPKPASTPAPTRHATQAPSAPPAQQFPVPEVPLRLDVPNLEFQENAFPLTDLRGYFLKERGLQWWVSNQADDLLALPHCRIERLDYQIRSALRVIGPLRGRALLSDEVGLGKTIEAGLVIKEWLTRGIVKRFLVLTVPSLVDQWAEELEDKFGIRTTTTNQAAFREDATAFWTQGTAVIASLATLRQPAHSSVAREVDWDLVVVDEAHHLRNRESMGWQAVNSLRRQFLLLLTATPVQNSLEELYNLVTLLQPGQLPTPREFRARFMDPANPRRPKEPEELRRLLGQVMIRNTRANAGIELPPRRAETVIFQPSDEERRFRTSWEGELRAALSRLSQAQASLWGRLLLQAAGSSPDAWVDALDRFPDSAAARAWRAGAPQPESWRRKCQLLHAVARAEGGVVVFTQFLATQSAIKADLEAARIPVLAIHGGTPASQRQPITERFRREGGALLLTRCGTEGRNLQFSHHLVNFDLPWNPMEIEQRIGRLHRLGQRRPVQILNLVQAGTLQEHLLEILQEKLNLFELVVGETGLVLGERFGSDEMAEEILRRWRESDGRLAEAFESLGRELAEARDAYTQIRQLDETLFAKDYEAL